MAREEMMENWLINGEEQNPLIILAHGAGAGSDSDFMQKMAQLLAAKGLYVVRFDFPYMLKRRTDGKRRPPDRAPALLEAYQQIVIRLNRPCVIAGKSMGGRMATLMATGDHVSTQIKGCVVLGYPFHPLGKPEKLRIDHLKSIDLPMLFLQGVRDKMGNLEEVREYPLADDLNIQWLFDGDHDLKPRKTRGVSHDRNLEAAAEAVSVFVKGLLPDCR